MQDETSTFDFVRVFDLQGNLKAVFQYTKARSASISTAGLREGSYVFEVGNTLRSEKLHVIIRR